MQPPQITRFVTGDYTAEDKKFVEEWIAENPANQRELEELQRVWELSKCVDIDVNVDQDWKRFKGRIAARKHLKYLNHKETGVSRIQTIIRFAAAAILLIGTFAVYRVAQQNSALSDQVIAQKPVYQTIVTTKGQVKHFSFKDGSKVVLNASSKLTYREDFGDSNRNIILVGEAFFEVNHDHPYPFIVHTPKTIVEDIGTKFNIKAYDDDSHEQVVVSEGSVKVLQAVETESNQSLKPSDKPLHVNSVVLIKGEQIKTDGLKRLVVEKANLDLTLGWLNKKIIFDAAPLDEVARQLERFYDIKIHVDQDVTIDQEITGSFNNESLNNVLMIISATLELQYTIEGNTVTFSK